MSLIDFYNKHKTLLPWQVWYFIDYASAKNKIPSLLHPQDYGDYIFMDNILGRHNHHAYLADKVAVRDYVAGKGLGSILTKIYGVWDDAEKIDFSALPKGFALKCNHSCATNIICQDKSSLDIDEAKNKLNKWLKQKHPIRFEQHYRRIKPLIYCEELIPFNDDGSFPADYKIHCAGGVPVFIQCCFERTSGDAGRRVIYDTKWNNLHYVINDVHYSDDDCDRPPHLREMLEDAAILSKGLEYVRVDFYDTPQRVIFGEMTLTPMGGWLSYFKQEALDIMGEAIRRNNKH